MARGASRTEGGTVSVLVGLVMMMGDTYLLRNGIELVPSFGFGAVFCRLGDLPVTGEFRL